ncbi:sulfur carrier protein ThiS [Azohydromonas caseinilytica]|uniref:Sulfur carrier protein ThiS n=1 Tax=Azohydromonas caseinilytica TaxID=2728836 RepID=A0A848F574_9BURK|nr:sulfur carrier protein ThiS [Azohydromonas caseinilytica]NML13749.1 sulfur carrier protein ThiS [Azohydromonas caseinilytica]
MSEALETIEIQLDGEPCRVAPCTLAELVQRLGHAAEGVGTALNGRFVPRMHRDRPLQPGDAVLLFKPIVGG